MPRQSLEHNEIELCQITVDWPCELVSVSAAVVSRSGPNAFEWLLASLIQSFAPHQLTFEEAAGQMGIKDSGFLKLIAQEMLRKNFLTAHSEAGNLQISDYTLAPEGIEHCFKYNRQSQEHGMLVWFDAITGRHLIENPQEITDGPLCPVIRTNLLPERLTHIGTARLTELARNQHEGFLEDDTEIVARRVDESKGCYRWAPVAVNAVISKDGSLHFRTTEPLQQRYINEPVVYPVLLQALKTTMLIPDFHIEELDASNTIQWLSRTNSIIAPQALPEILLGAIDSADKSIFIHGMCLDNNSIVSAINLAAKRGIRCTISIASNKSPAAHLANHGNIHLVRIDAHLPACAIIDGTRAISLDKLTVAQIGKQKHEIIVASAVKDQMTLQLQKFIINAAVAA